MPAADHFREPSNRIRTLRHDHIGRLCHLPADPLAVELLDLDVDAFCRDPEIESSPAGRAAFKVEVSRSQSVLDLLLHRIGHGESLLPVCRYSDHAADGFCPLRDIGLFPPPIVDYPYQIVIYAHLEGPVLVDARRPAFTPANYFFLFCHFAY